MLFENSQLKQNHECIHECISATPTSTLLVGFSMVLREDAGRLKKPDVVPMVFVGMKHVIRLVLIVRMIRFSVLSRLVIIRFNF